MQAIHGGKILPTGKYIESIDNIEVTCMDVAMPMVLMRAADFSLKGNESKAELDAMPKLIACLEKIRLEAGLRRV